MKTAWFLALALALTSCKSCPAPTSDAAAPDVAVPSIEVANDSADETTVSVTFGSDSVVLPAAWSSFCTALETGAVGCTFKLAHHASQALPTGGSYLNATLAFDKTVGCGSTKAELNVNNPNWYNIVDISLVDGFSSALAILIVEPGADGGEKRTLLGPVVSKTGNEKDFGVYPLGCDICVARQQPSCGMSPGKEGCKAGTQNNPSPPCQFQGSTMGGGGTKIRIARLAK